MSDVYVECNGAVSKVVEEVQTINTFSWVRCADGNTYKINTCDLDWDERMKVIPGKLVDKCACGKNISSTIKDRDHQYVCGCGIVWNYISKLNTFTKRE